MTIYEGDILNLYLYYSLHGRRKRKEKSVTDRRRKRTQLRRRCIDSQYSSVCPSPASLYIEIHEAASQIHVSGEVGDSAFEQMILSGSLYCAAQQQFVYLLEEVVQNGSTFTFLHVNQLYGLCSRREFYATMYCRQFCTGSFSAGQDACTNCT